MSQRTLFELVQWVEQEGPPRGLSRVRLKMLGATLKHRVDLENVRPDTVVDPSYLEAFEVAARDVIADTVR